VRSSDAYIPTALKQGLDEEKVIPLQKAASWAVIGAIVTLVAGAFVQSLPFRYADSIAIAIPLGFVVRWGVLHMRGTSVMNVEYLELEANQYYRTLIDKVVSANVEKKASTQPDQVFRDCGLLLLGDPPWWALTAVLRHGKSFVSEESLNNLLGKLSFTHDKFNELVNLLVKEKRLRRGHAGELLQPVPEKKLLP
jgi:hypothetical protein